MFAERLRTMVSRWLPDRFYRSTAPSSGEVDNLNEMLAEIPLDQAQYRVTDEFSFLLKPSSISGVGVFCTHGIAKGTRLALFPQPRLRWFRTRFFSNNEIERDPRLKRYCDVYGVARSRGTHVARNFCWMQVGWYLNHSEQPNAHRTRNRYFASRDIEADEEITIDYRVL